VFLPNRQKSSLCNGISQYNVCISRFLLFQCSIIYINIISMAEFTLNNIAVCRARQNLYFVQMSRAGTMRLSSIFTMSFWASSKISLLSSVPFRYSLAGPVAVLFYVTLVLSSRRVLSFSFLSLSLSFSVCPSLYEH